MKGEECAQRKTNLPDAVAQDAELASVIALVRPALAVPSRFTSVSNHPPQRDLMSLFVPILRDHSHLVVNLPPHSRRHFSSEIDGRLFSGEYVRLPVRLKNDIIIVVGGSIEEGKEIVRAHQRDSE